MPKTLDENFRDWESTAFGFGYGSGEEHILPALKRFLALCRNEPSGRSYDYRELEADLTPTVAWLLINRLCQQDIIEYGTSPRFGWLTHKGEALQTYTASKTEDELAEVVCVYDSDYPHCYPDACNCGPNGYEESAVCQNPFWGENRGFVRR